MFAVLQKLRPQRSGSSIKVVSALAGGNFFAAVLTFITSVLVSRYVNPSQLGFFNKFVLVSTYLVFLHIGTFDLLNREYPYLIGKGKRDEAVAYAATCLGWNLLMTGLCTVGMLTLVIFYLFRHDMRYAIGWLVQIPAIVWSLYGGYLTVTFRTGREFARLSVVNVLRACTSLVMLSVVVFFPYFGLCARAAGMAIVATLFLHHFRPLHVKPAFDVSILKVVLKRGLPLFTIGYADITLWKALESTFVLRFLGTHHLGLFSMVAAGSMALLTMPDAVNQIYLPRFAKRFGETHKIIDCVRMSIKPTALTFLAVSLFAVGYAVLVGPAVRILVPKYVESIPAMVWSSVAVAVYALRIPAQILYASGKIAQHGTAVFIGLAVFCLTALLSLHYGWGMVGVVLSSALGKFIRISVSYLLIYRAVKQERRMLVAPA